MVEAYLNAGMDKEYLGPALHHSSCYGHLRIVNALLSANAGVNYTGGFGSTPLHGSCLKGFIAITSVLIAAHADVNARNFYNATPLSLSVLNGHADIVSLFRDAGVTNGQYGR